MVFLDAESRYSAPMSLGVLTREITKPVPLRLASGIVNPDAIGFSRAPLHQAAGRETGQDRRRDHWLVSTPTHILMIATGRDQRGVQQRLWVLDRATRAHIEIAPTRPRDAMGSLPQGPETGPIRVHSLDLDISIDEVPGGTRLRVYGSRVQLDLRVGRPLNQQSLGTVVSHDNRSFDYVLSDLARPVSGRLAIDGRWEALAPESTWAVHNYSHGCHRRDLEEVRAEATGIGILASDSSVHRLGIRLGAGSGFLVDGVLAYDASTAQSERLEDGRIRLHGPRFELSFTPLSDAPADARGERRANVGLFAGWIEQEPGARFTVSGLTGWLSLPDAPTTTR